VSALPCGSEKEKGERGKGKERARETKRNVESRAVA
jgi:hypothetical protein